MVFPRKERNRAGRRRRRDQPRDGDSAHRQPEAEAIERYRKELNITRLGRPEDIAGLVAFIVSPRGRWLHGTGVDMDGGQVEPLRMSRYD